MFSQQWAFGKGQREANSLSIFQAAGEHHRAQDWLPSPVVWLLLWMGEEEPINRQHPCSGFLRESVDLVAA